MLIAAERGDYATVARYLIVFAMIVIGMYFVCVVPVMGQSQEVLNERFSQGIEANEKSIERITSVHVSERLAVLEDTIFEVKWMGRTVAAAVIAQIMLQVYESKRRR